MKTIDFSYFIERFNAGEMNEAEEAWFRKELEGNAELRTETDLRKKADHVIIDHDVIDLRQKLAEIEKKRKVAVPSRLPGKKVFLGIAAAITGFVLLGSIAISGNQSLTNDELISKYGRSFEGVYASRSTTDNVNDDYTKGVDYYNIHDFENARRYFSKIIKADPENMASTMYCGTSNFELKNYPTATELFNKVIKNNDNLFIEDAELYLAFCYIQTDDNKKAIDILKQIKESRSVYRKDAANILRHIKK